jgi:hypothetical protein
MGGKIMISKLYVIIAEGNILSANSFWQPGRPCGLLPLGTPSSDNIGLGNSLFERKCCQF